MRKRSPYDQSVSSNFGLDQDLKREGCGDQVARFLWVEEAGAEDGDLEHRLCRERITGK